MSDTIPQAAGAADLTYWAFISYSHHDEAWATWLHRRLEAYQVPRALVGRQTEAGKTPRRLIPVFRDRDELPGAADLGAKIREALRLSRFLIVICSPHAAGSKWVNEEVKWFKTLGREGRVLCLIVAGEPNADDRPERGELECFPPAVRFRVGEDGALTTIRNETLAADVREGKDGRRNAPLKLLAGLLDVGFDALRRREARRRFRQRVTWTLGLTIAVMASLLGYLALADWSAESSRLPGAHSTRDLLDRHEITFLRPVHSESAVREAAAELRRALVQSLSPLARTYGARSTVAKPDNSVWIMTQLFSALLRAAEATHVDRMNAARALEIPFATGAAVEAGGVRYGWIPAIGNGTMAEPALWATVALSLLHSQRDLLDEAARRKLLQSLAYAQSATQIYNPLTDGGWNTFPNQELPDQHYTYTTSLALLALLEGRVAGLPWEGATGRDPLLASTANWLVQHFEAGAAQDGEWETTFVTSRNDGLSLYVFRELLWAEEQGVLTLPEPIRAAIPQHLLRLGERTLDSTSATTGYIFINYRNHKGQFFVENPGTEFPWHPGAIGCAARWLASAEARQAPNELRFRVRRVLGHLIVDLRDEVLARLRSDHPFRFPTYHKSELLYSLALIPEPEK